MIYIRILQVHLEVLNLLWINVFYLHGNLAAGKFLTKNCCLLECIYCTIRVDTTLETERCICTQTMTAGTLSYPCGMEIRTLEYHVACGVVCSRSFTAKHTGNTHRLFCVAYSQVAVGQFMIFTVKCYEWCTFRHRLHHNLMTFHHVCIKAMERLAVCHHNIVGDVYDIVNWAQAYCSKFVLQPIWTFLYFTTGNAYTCISLACIGINDFHVYRQVFVVNSKAFIRRTMKRCLISILLQPSIQVTGNTPMRKSICAVCRDINLNEPVALKIVILSSRCSHLCIFWKHDYTIMTCPDAYLILSADHTVRLNATKF